MRISQIFLVRISASYSSNLTLQTNSYKTSIFLVHYFETLITQNIDEYSFISRYISPILYTTVLENIPPKIQIKLQRINNFIELLCIAFFCFIFLIQPPLYFVSNQGLQKHFVCVLLCERCHHKYKQADIIQVNLSAF